MPAATAPTGSSPRHSLLMPLASASLWAKLRAFLIASLVIVGLLLQFQLHLGDWLEASVNHHRRSAAYEAVQYRTAVVVDFFERHPEQFTPADLDSLRSLKNREALLAIAVKDSEAETSTYLRSAMFDVGILLTLLLLSSIYRICGREKPAWTMLVAAITCLVLLKTLWPLLWGHLFYWWVPQAWSNSPVALFRLAFFVLCTGPAEESFKAIPVILMLFIGRNVAIQFRSRVGVWEPLDGILLAAASGAAFALLESGTQYFTQVLEQFAQNPSVGFDNACMMAFGVGIYRFFFTSMFHTSLSALNGYAIGLAVLMPKHRWRLVLGIFAITSVLHGIYNANPFPRFVAVTDYGSQHPLFPYAVALFTLMLMLAAILKARQLSPTRSQNFATLLAVGNSPGPMLAPPPLPKQGTPATGPRIALTPVPQPAATAPDTLSLRVGAHRLELVPGRAVAASDLPGVPAQPGSSIVGEVMLRPGLPGALGLMNRSAITWYALSPDGSRRDVAPLSVVSLRSGLRLQLGKLEVEVI